MNFSALPAATDAYMLVLGSICNFVRLAAVQIAGQVAIGEFHTPFVSSCSCFSIPIVYTSLNKGTTMQRSL